MARKLNVRRIKKHRCYTIDEIAELTGFHPQTVRSWVKDGLPVMKDSTPHLVLAEDLIEFAAASQLRESQPLLETEFYCLKCRCGREAAGAMADYFPDRTDSGRLVALCSCCETTMQRFVRLDELEHSFSSLDITHQAPLKSLVDTKQPPLGTQKKGHEQQ